MSYRTWVQIGLLSLMATAASALPITLTGTLTEGTQAQLSQFQIVVNNGGNIVQGAPHTTWLNGTLTETRDFYTSTVEGTLASMFLPYTLAPGDVVNSAMLDLSSELFNAVGYVFQRNNTGVFAPDFQASSSQLYAVLSVGSFSMVIDPLAPTVNLAAAIAEIQASNQFRIDWMLRTVFTADTSNFSRGLDTGTTTVWSALAMVNFDANAWITLNGGNDNDNDIDAIPEAGSVLLTGGGLALLGLWRRRRQRA